MKITETKIKVCYCLFNYKDKYNLSYIDMELMNTEECPYCSVGVQRVQEELDSQYPTLF